MSFKKPNSKNTKEALIAVGALALGGALSRGVNGAIPAQHKDLAKLAVAGTSLAAGLTYNGKGKTLVKTLCYGMSSLQLLHYATEQAQKHMQRKADAGAMQKFIDDAAGLNGSCGCQDANIASYQALNAPTIQAITWDETFSANENTLDVSHQEIAWTGN